MFALPSAMATVLQPFAAAFWKPTWEHVLVLLVGALLTPGARTVTAILRVMGLANETHFQTYHRVLSRDHWSSLTLSRTLLRLLLHTFLAADVPVVIALDETIERRRGDKIAAKGIYRDPARSSRSHFVKTSGLRWMVMMLLTPIPWAERVWALPFLSVLAPSERFYQERKRRHKPMLLWAQQMVAQLRRWLPERSIVIVADSTYAVLEFLHRCSSLPKPVSVITRLRLDAALYDPAPVRRASQRGRPRKKGNRQPTLARRLQQSQTTWQTITVVWYGGSKRTIQIATASAVWYHTGKEAVPIRWVLIRDANPQATFEPQALLSTDLTLTAQQIVEWFVLRWQEEVTFHEVRTHLGVETQRQWSERAILRTTPALFGLFSLVTLVAHQMCQGQGVPVRQASWYTKELPTFSDTLAFVRQQLWPVAHFRTSQSKPDVVKISRALFERLTDTLAYAA